LVSAAVSHSEKAGADLPAKNKTLTKELIVKVQAESDAEAEKAGWTTASGRR